MNGTKKPWQSKTNWMGFFGILFAILALIGVNIEEEALVNLSAAAVSVSSFLTIVFRNIADKKVKL